MKQLILMAAIVASLTAKSQFFVGTGAGYNTTSKRPAVELSMGYDAKVAFIQAGFLADISRKAENGALFNVRMGHTVPIGEAFSVQPSLGYGYVIRSTDVKELNSGGIMGSLYLIKETAVDQLQLFAGGNYSNKAVILSLGIRFRATRE